MAAIFGCSQENFSCTDIIVAYIFGEKQPSKGIDFFFYSCIIELDTKTIKKLYEVVRGDIYEYGYEL